MFSRDLNLSLNFFFKVLTTLEVKEKDFSTSVICKIKTARDVFLKSIVNIVSDKQLFDFNNRQLLDSLSKKSNNNFSVGCLQNQKVKKEVLPIKSFLNKESNYFLLIKVSLFDIILILRELGFYHKKKKQPIGNQRMLLLSDYNIICRYSNLMYDILS